MFWFCSGHEQPRRKDNRMGAWGGSVDREKATSKHVLPVWQGLTWPEGKLGTCLSLSHTILGPTFMTSANPSHLLQVLPAGAIRKCQWTFKVIFSLVHVQRHFSLQQDLPVWTVLCSLCSVFWEQFCVRQGISPSLPCVGLNKSYFVSILGHPLFSGLVGFCGLSVMPFLTPKPLSFFLRAV